MAVAPVPDLRPVRPPWTHRHEATVLAAFVVVSEAVGLLGARITPRDQAWYSHLARPTFAPPSWVFAPVWAVLSAATAVAAWFVWRHHRTWQRDVALRWWALQLVLNAAWTPLFFDARQPVWALVDLSVLGVVAAITTVRFLPFDRRASALFVPYLAWLGFALALNGAIVAMN
jgi:benzodiazapine receptor